LPLFDELNLLNFTRVDIFEKLSTEKTPLGKHSQYGHGYFAFPKLEGEIGPIMKFRGKEVLNWSLNNYLGLANHPEVRKVDAEAAAQYGLAYPMGARMMSGNTTLHEQLEDELSKFVGKEDTILLNYGYQGIMSAIDTLLNRHDIVIYDSESHACIVDGVRLHLGMFGIDEFTSILNSPEACILSVGGIKQVPVVKNNQITTGNIMRVTLGCDHRVVDGAVGAAFLQTFKTLMEDPVRILL